jgi:hypothetical protein
MHTFKSFLYALNEEELFEDSITTDLKTLVGKEVDKSVDEIAKKIKAWAIEQMNLAIKSGISVVTYKKL